MFAFVITVAISVLVNYLLIVAYRHIINEAEDYGAVLAKTINDYPLALTALSVVFPIISTIMVALYLLFLRNWIPHARNHNTKDKNND